jgi:CubicO group peptidase (beta-lactamase class C family)
MFFQAYGYAQIEPQRVAMKKKTVFDIASLTKPIATALSVMILQERKLLKLDDRVADVLPDLGKNASSRTTIKQLLTHTSGLPAWYPTYLVPEHNRLAHIAQLNTHNKEVTYSCLGYLLLGKIIERAANKPLNEFFREHVAMPLDCKTLGFRPITTRENVAATEHGNAHEQGMARRYGDISMIKWRRYLLQGEVHDGNAFYGFGGVAGNAGLFSNTQDLVKFTRAYMSVKLIKKTAVQMMTKDHTGGEEKRGLGWRIDMYPGMLSPASFGHTGFTGTMLVVDPASDLIIILLANAIHPHVKIGLMNPIRKEAVRIISTSVNLK